MTPDAAPTLLYSLAQPNASMNKASLRILKLLKSYFDTKLFHLLSVTIRYIHEDKGPVKLIQRVKIPHLFYL